MSLAVPKISDFLNLAAVQTLPLEELVITSYSILTGELVSPRESLCKCKQKGFNTGTASEEESTGEIL